MSRFFRSNLYDLKSNLKSDKIIYNYVSKANYSTKYTTRMVGYYYVIMTVATPTMFTLYGLYKGITTISSHNKLQKYEHISYPLFRVCNVVGYTISYSLIGYGVSMFPIFMPLTIMTIYIAEKN